MEKKSESQSTFGSLILLKELMCQTRPAKQGALAVKETIFTVDCMCIKYRYEVCGQ